MMLGHPGPARSRGRKLPGRSLVALLGLTLGLAGCSALKVGYNNLDWITAWQIGRFVDLAPRQKALFDEGFREFWQWHRGTQLELYVRDLRELAATLERPLSAARVEDYLARSQEHAGRMLSELVPETARVLATLEDRQVAGLLDKLAARRREQAEQIAGKSLEEQREDAAARMERALDRWTGTVTREQEGRIRRWAADRAYAGAIWQQYQAAWAEAFGAVLARRTEPGLEPRLAELFANDGRMAYGEEMAKVQAHNRQVWVEAMADLSRILSPDQRRYLQKRLRDLATDLEELSRERREAARPAPIG